MHHLNLPRVQEISDGDLSTLDINVLIEGGQPIILRNGYKDKALVQYGLQSDHSAMNFIRRCHNGEELTAFVADAESRGRFFYNADTTGLNFEASKMDLDYFLDEIVRTNACTKPKAYYAGSTDIKTFFPHMLEADELVPNNELFKLHPPIISIWMGNRTTAPTHFDMSNNVAACMVGRRRFTLFPPEQIHNLYPGPLFPTPAGQVVSMVDLKNPDHGKYPNFSKAFDAAQVAELNPGDILIYPAMWWHQVEALDGFNVLINYWWNNAPSHLDIPMNTLLHGILSLRGRPDYEKEAWRELFDFYLFADMNKATDHIAPKAHGFLGKIDANMGRRLRMILRNKMNR